MTNNPQPEGNAVVDIADVHIDADGCTLAGTFAAAAEQAGSEVMRLVTDWVRRHWGTP